MWCVCAALVRTLKAIGVVNAYPKYADLPGFHRHVTRQTGQTVKTNSRNLGLRETHAVVPTVRVASGLLGLPRRSKHTFQRVTGGALNVANVKGRVGVISVKIAATEGGEVKTILPTENVHEIGFSPQGSYVITWQRPSTFPTQFRSSSSSSSSSDQQWISLPSPPRNSAQGADFLPFFPPPSQAG